VSTDRAGYIRGLRALADVLERNDDLPLPYDGTATAISFNGYVNSADPVTEMVAAIQVIPCSFTSRIRNAKRPSDAYLYLDGELHGLKLDLVAFCDVTCVKDKDGQWHPVDSITALAPEADGAA
jgi:hypothetical protein